MKNSLQLLAVAIIFLGLGFFLARSAFFGKEPALPETSPTEDFSSFLYDFHSNPVFQKERTLFPLLFVTVSDPEVFGLDTFLIESAQWTPFLFFDTTGTLVTILPLSCHAQLDPPCQYSVIMQGLHHGEQVKFIFEDHQGKWMLLSFEDVSM